MELRGQQVGYVRVSTFEQSSARQLEGVYLDQRFEEHASAKDVDRPVLQECIKYVRKGDTLHVHSIDRLARNLQDLQRLVERLTKKGVSLHFHKEGLVFDGGESPIQRLLLQVIGSVAEFERALIKERQREGIAAAKAQGRGFGRKPILSPEQVEEIRARVARGEEKKKLAREYGVTRQTVYAALAR